MSSAPQNPPPSPAPVMLSVAAAAARLGISRMTLYGLIDRGDLLAYRIAGTILRISEDDLHQFLQRSRTGGDDVRTPDSEPRSPGRPRRTS